MHPLTAELAMVSRRLFLNKGTYSVTGTKATRKLFLYSLLFSSTVSCLLMLERVNLNYGDCAPGKDSESKAEREPARS